MRKCSVIGSIEAESLENATRFAGSAPGLASRAAQEPKACAPHSALHKFTLRQSRASHNILSFNREFRVVRRRMKIHRDEADGK